MKRLLALILLLLAFPSLVFANAVPLSDLLTAADDYWKTSTPQRPSLIQGGKINTSQQYVPVPSSATMGLVGFASGAAALGGLAFYQHTGKDPVIALVDGLHHAFQPAWLAFQENFVSPESFPASAAQSVGVEAAIGAKLSDICDFVKNSASGVYSSLSSLIDQFTSESSPGIVDTIAVGQVYPFQGQNWEITGDSDVPHNSVNITGEGTPAGWVVEFSAIRMVDGVPHNIGAGTISGTPAIISRYLYVQYSNGTRVYRWEFWKFPMAPTSEPVTNPPTPGSVDYPGLAEQIQNSPDPEVNQDLAEVIPNLPSTQVQIAIVAPTGSVAGNSLDHPSISPQALEQFFSSNAALVSGEALQVANDPLATPAEVAAAQVAADAAKATAEQAQDQMEPTPETYTDVPLSGFEEPYNPGPFDIPDRFDTFLANVAGTGLFSLPSQYFNSLPSGGSPIYTIEAGTYGTHTVDLSETMGTGLAVLKTVLLLCFAFLSVRVVVLKR